MFMQNDMLSAILFGGSFKMKKLTTKHVFNRDGSIDRNAVFAQQLVEQHKKEEAATGAEFSEALRECLYEYSKD